MGNTRREIIQNMLSEQPFVSLKELSARFPELSSMTLRRDIEYFESQGECIKVRGGARSMKFITTSLEESFNLRLHANSAAKEAIAARAAEMIELQMRVTDARQIIFPHPTVSEIIRETLWEFEEKA